MVNLVGQLASWSDEELLQSAIAGQQTCWTELVDRYHGKGFAFVRRQIDDPYLAQDVMQNLWIALVQAVQREQPDHFSGFFWTLLRRRLIDELRRKGRTKEAALLDAPVGSDDRDGQTLLDRFHDTQPEPLQSAVQTEERQLLQTALDQLPDHYRLVIIARQLEGRSNRETAQLLIAQGLLADDGDVEKRAENYYYRGLKELRRQLLALGFEGGGSAA